MLRKATTPPEPTGLAERSIYYATDAYQEPFGRFKSDWITQTRNGKAAFTIADAVNREWFALEQALKSLFVSDTSIN